MRKFFGASLALLMLGAVAPANAADIPGGSAMAQAPRRAPLQPIYSWQGFYVGGNIGYSWGPWDSTGVVTAPTGSHNAKVDGWIGGVQGGYNWQPNKDWLAGLEADYQWSGEKHSFTWSLPAGVAINDVPAGFTIAQEWKLKWLATFRGRIGMTPSPDWLIYLTGGAAVGKATYSLTASLGALSVRFEEDKTKWGWTLGGGVEKMLNRNWSAKVEYLYVDLGKYTFVNTFSDSKLRDHILRLGVNYKFN